MAEISIVAWKYQLNEDGTLPIRIRIAKSGKKSYIGVTSIPPDDWDDSAKVVTGKNKKAKNLLIQQRKLDIENLAADMERKNPKVLPRQIKEAFEGDKGDFFAFAKEFIKPYNNEAQQYTFVKFNIALDELKAYCKSESLSFHQLDYSLLSRLKKHLQQRGNEDSTIEAKFAKLRTIYLDKVKSVPADFVGVPNPFKDITYKKSTKKKEKLTRDEINMLRSAVLKTANQELSRDVFLWCFNNMGMRVGDAVTFPVGRKKTEHRDGLEVKYVEYRMRKSSDQLRIELTGEAEKIYDKYSEGKSPGDYLFPMLDRSRKKDNPLYKRIDSATSMINMNLKKIAKIAGIDKHITTHVNRHSFTNIALKLGVPEEVRMAMLGHESTKTHRAYVGSLDDDALNKANRLITE